MRTTSILWSILKLVANVIEKQQFLRILGRLCLHLNGVYSLDASCTEERYRPQHGLPVEYFTKATWEFLPLNSHSTPPRMNLTFDPNIHLRQGRQKLERFHFRPLASQIVPRIDTSFFVKTFGEKELDICQASFLAQFVYFRLKGRSNWKTYTSNGTLSFKYVYRDSSR